MSERNRPMSFPRYSARKCERRPVTKEDTWCRQTMPQWYQDKDEDGDDIGYIITVPCKEKGIVILGKIGGYIVRSKKIGGLLLLQVVPNKKQPEYTIVFYENGLPTRARINIRCENKGGYRWCRLLL